MYSETKVMTRTPVCCVKTTEGLAKYSRAFEKVLSQQVDIHLLSNCFLASVQSSDELRRKPKREGQVPSKHELIGGLSSLCALAGVDLLKPALNEPFNFGNEDLAGAGIQGKFNNFKMVEKDKPWTPRMFGENVGFGGFGPVPVGTPEQVADMMEKWFVEADIVGFNPQCECSPTPALLAPIIL